MMPMSRKQLALRRMAFDVAAGKVSMSKYREAEKRHNAALYKETKK